MDDPGFSAAPGDAEAENAIRRLALCYARAVDRRDTALFRQVFRADSQLVVRGRTHEGVDQIGLIPGRMAERYLATRHLVHNHLIEVAGDAGEDMAWGEVYCDAHHLKHDAPEQDHVMAIRYQDRYRRDAEGLWYIRRRELVIDWTCEIGGAQR